MRLPSFCLESALLEEVDGDDLVGLLTVYGLSACWAVANSAVVVLLRCNQGPG